MAPSVEVAGIGARMGSRLLAVPESQTMQADHPFSSPACAHPAPIASGKRLRPELGLACLGQGAA